MKYKLTRKERDILNYYLWFCGNKKYKKEVIRRSPIYNRGSFHPDHSLFAEPKYWNKCIKLINLISLSIRPYNEYHTRETRQAKLCKMKNYTSEIETRFQEKGICTLCGIDLYRDADYCHNCGHKLETY